MPEPEKTTLEQRGYGTLFVCVSFSLLPIAFSDPMCKKNKIAIPIHSALLIRFVACGGRKRDNRQKRDRQTHRPSSITLAVHARRGLKIVKASKASEQANMVIITGLPRQNSTSYMHCGGISS